MSGLLTGALWTGRMAVRVGALLILSPIVLVYLVVALAFATLVAAIVHWLIVGGLFGGRGDLADSLPEILLFVALCGTAWLGAILTVWQRSGLATMFGGGAGDTHGSARFAGRREIAALRRSKTGLLIGRNPERPYDLLRYDGPGHLLTLAPTRSGKGVGTVIPNLLVADRSVLVIDPKGENARLTGAARKAFGAVHVLDPFGITGYLSAAYNPLDRLDPTSLDLGEDAATLADALVMDPPSQVSEAHWNEEAKALLTGLILFAAVHEDPGRRTLASVREYLTLPPERFQDLLKLMQESAGAAGLIARAANRHLGKAEREAASVLSNAQRHTHFLDSPRMSQVLGRTDFRFADLKHRTLSIFLVLPPDRLGTYARWLRLLIAQALQEIARDGQPGQEAPQTSQALSQALSQAPETTTAPLSGPKTPEEAPRPPVLFLLDEFAALGHLEAIERAMGLMAGYGLQLWPILQDLSQLRGLYDRRAGTFIANSGVLQTFGVNDLETAEWLSRSLGQATIGFATRTSRPGDDPSTSENVTGRALMTPDEIMKLPAHLQILRLQGMPPALVRKIVYFQDPEFKTLFGDDQAVNAAANAREAHS
ncbi:MAG: type IV secretory system conjugative DNA transfer family protein [Pseudomonadota bacterium]